MIKILTTPAKGGYIFSRVCVFVCLSVSRDYLQNNIWICMQLLPDVCFGPWGTP